MRRLVGLAGLLALTCATADGQAWDNNIKPNGSGARAISPPGFPNIRVVDDFVLPVSERYWLIQGIYYSATEDAAWEWADGDGIEVTIYADKFREGPGKLITTRTPGGSKVATGQTYFGRAEYVYLADFERNAVMLRSGTYWIGVRHPTAGGSGTNYWMTSDGGRDGKDSSTGYVSFDAGQTWQPEGRIWHHAFVLQGAPEPTTLALLAVGGLAALHPRRRL